MPLLPQTSSDETWNPKLFSALGNGYSIPAYSFGHIGVNSQFSTMRLPTVNNVL